MSLICHIVREQEQQVGGGGVAESWIKIMSLPYFLKWATKCWPSPPAPREPTLTGPMSWQWWWKDAQGHGQSLSRIGREGGWLRDCRVRKITRAQFAVASLALLLNQHENQVTTKCGKKGRCSIKVFINGRVAEKCREKH